MLEAAERTACCDSSPLCVLRLPACRLRSGAAALLHGFAAEWSRYKQKSGQRIGFSSMGLIDRAAGSGEPQVKALASRWIPRPRPKIRSFGGTFAWHRALTPPERLFRARRRFSRPGGGRGASRLPAGAPGGGPAGRGAQYKTTHVMHKTAFSNEGMRGGEKSASFDARGSSLPSLYLEKVDHHETTTHRYAERQIPTAHPLSIPSIL